MDTGLQKEVDVGNMAMSKTRWRINLQRTLLLPCLRATHSFDITDILQNAPTFFKIKLA